MFLARLLDAVHVPIIVLDRMRMDIPLLNDFSSHQKVTKMNNAIKNSSHFYTQNLLLLAVLGVLFCIELTMKFYFWCFLRLLLSLARLV